MNEEIDIILSRYFSGEASQEELHTLDIWLSQSDENEKYFHQTTLLYQYTGQTNVAPAIDTEKALAQFQAYMRENQSDSRRIFFTTSNLWKAAAAVVLLAMTTFALYYFIQPSKPIQLMAVETQKEYTIFENADVTLFPGAEIIYHKKSNHQLQLKGKAVFNIQSDNAKKLVVQAGETYIEDIGTIFSIDATAPDQSITVEVTEGEVWFYTDKNSGVHLKAGESAVYDSQIKQFNMIARIEELIDNEMVFYNMPLYEAIELIKSRYHVDITIGSNALNEMLLNVSFDNNESVEYVLEVITATLSAHLSKKNDGYVIMF